MRLNINRLGRDSQRRKLYTAENAAWCAMSLDQRGLDTNDPIVYRQFLNGIMGSEWMARNFLKAVTSEVKVEFSAKLRGANANESRIRTGRGSFTMSRLILCHELSHTIVRRQYGRKMYACDDGGTLHDTAFGLTNYSTHRIAGHGPEYADVYLRVVREFVGYDMWKALRASFDKHGVRYIAPSDYRKRVSRPFVLSLARPEVVRNSNPNVSSQVLVNGTPYSSVRVAFEQLGLPMSAHQKFRKELKLNGANTIYWNGVQHTFITLPR